MKSRTQGIISPTRMFERIHSVMFHVPDVEAACEWYSRPLDVPPVYLHGDFPVLRLGSVEICFYQANSKVSFGKSGVVAYWQVADFQKAVARAHEMGGVIHRGPLDIPDGSRVCQIADPFGNPFGLAGPRAARA